MLREVIDVLLFYNFYTYPSVTGPTESMLQLSGHTFEDIGDFSWRLAAPIV